MKVFCYVSELSKKAFITDTSRNHFQVIVQLIHKITQ